MHCVDFVKTLTLAQLFVGYYLSKISQTLHDRGLTLMSLNHLDQI